MNLNKLVPFEGIINPKFAIVGERPGYEEWVQEGPFKGRSGQLLDSVLKELGIDRINDCYITNIVKTYAENNKTPTDQEIFKWSYLLHNELLIVNPKVIITLGASAYKGVKLDDYVKITEIRGNIEEVILGNDGGDKTFTLVPTLHPSFCLRFSDKTEDLIEDFKTALEYLKENNNG